MSYLTPRALQHALNERARHHGVRADRVLRLFLFSRLLARVFRHDPDGWLLKGGQALLVRFPDARYTRDIDLCRTADASLDEAVDALIRAARLDLDDLVTFEPREREDRLDERGVARLGIHAHLGGRLKDTISVDLVVEGRPIGRPELRPLEPPVHLDWPDSWPSVRLYPLTDHVADKISAMYERHGSTGLPSTRYRDLVDLALIALREKLDGQQLCAALRAEVDRRGGMGRPLALPMRFAVPGPGWSGGYARAAADVVGLENYRTLDRAAVLAQALLDPVLGGRADSMTWQPDLLAWR